MLRHLTRTDHTSFFGRLLRLPLRLVPAATVVRIPSGLNKGFRWVCGSSIQRCWFGTYEFEKQDFVAGVVKPGMTIWDVGANVGFYTLAFARLAGASGSVLSFEPLAANASHLLRHIELNSLTNVKVIQAALSDSTDLLGFTATTTSSEGALGGRELHYMVPTITPASILAALPSSKPHLIKLDVEGAEGAVLSAARGLLAECSPDILLALHGRAQEEQCVQLLTELGYTLSYLDGSRVEIDQPLQSDEVFASRRPKLPQQSARASLQHVESNGH